MKTFLSQIFGAFSGSLAREPYKKYFNETMSESRVPDQVNQRGEGIFTITESQSGRRLILSGHESLCTHSLWIDSSIQAKTIFLSVTFQ